MKIKYPIPENQLLTTNISNEIFVKLVYGKVLNCTYKGPDIGDMYEILNDVTLFFKLMGIKL
jgi:hypothetical protein